VAHEKEDGLSDPPGEDPRDFVLSRDLSEIHLLLDHVSSNAVASLSGQGLSMTPPLLPANWIEQVCEISWPPPDSSIALAEQAGLLIRVREHLNGLASPANGMTVAFTLLVVQQAKEGGDDRAWMRGGDMPIGAEVPTRWTMAYNAYPNLMDKARSFQRMTKWVRNLLLAWLAFTCLTSWYVAYGNAMLGDLAVAETKLRQAEDNVTGVEAGLAAEPIAASATGQDRPTGMTSSFCRNDSGGSAAALGTPAQREVCSELAARRVEVAKLTVALRRWLPLFHSSDEQLDVTVAAKFIGVMGSAVLPFFYGLLGAGAAVVRSWSYKIKRSLLAPQDIQLSFQQLALGAVVGACIGLFIAQPDDESALIGPAALSGSALSFLAGFGVDKFFEALETLLGRVFPSESKVAGQRA
jgi:hypothetical protein